MVASELLQEVGLRQVGGCAAAAAGGAAAASEVAPAAAVAAAVGWQDRTAAEAVEILAGQDGSSLPVAAAGDLEEVAAAVGEAAAVAAFRVAVAAVVPSSLARLGLQVEAAVPERIFDALE